MKDRVTIIVCKNKINHPEHNAHAGDVTVYKGTSIGGYMSVLWGEYPRESWGDILIWESADYDQVSSVLSKYSFSTWNPNE
jgi:hypothetical protein